jgi:hypothetical protein
MPLPSYECGYTLSMVGTAKIYTSFREGLGVGKNCLPNNLTQSPLLVLGAPFL